MDKECFEEFKTLRDVERAQTKLNKNLDERLRRLEPGGELFNPQPKLWENQLRFNRILTILMTVQVGFDVALVTLLALHRFFG